MYLISKSQPKPVTLIISPTLVNLCSEDPPKSHTSEDDTFLILYGTEASLIVASSFTSPLNLNETTSVEADEAQITE